MLDLIYTSYFTRFDKLVRRGEDNVFDHQGISIARSKPKGTSCTKDYSKLAPSWELLGHWLNHNISWGQYTEEYNAQLEELDAHEVLEDLVAMMNGPEVIPILLCWENADGLCHRILVANWLERELRIRVREI